MTDLQIFNLIDQEQKRQEQTLMLIPSENYASAAVFQAVGSCLANKYAEGYPNRRYYQGQKFVDQIEQLAIDRAKKLFNVPFANVQPLSGAAANLAALNAVLNPGDKLMGLGLAAGGHLTHGAKASITGKIYQAQSYQLDESGRLNYKEIEKLANEFKPDLIVAGFTAYPFVIDWSRFADIAQKVKALLLADISHLSGLIAGKAYPSPVEFVDIITTTTHKTLRGPRGAIIMATKKGLAKDPDLGKKINQSVFPGLQGGPHMNTIAGIAVALAEAGRPNFCDYAREVINNAKALADELISLGFNLVGGGTESHLILIDLTGLRISGNLAAEALEATGIVVNKNLIPNDPGSSFYPSGLRIGTPAITSRGMGKQEMKQIAQMISQVINDLAKQKRLKQMTLEDERAKQKRQALINSLSVASQVKQAVGRLCQRFPIRREYK